MDVSVSRELDVLELVACGDVLILRKLLDIVNSIVFDNLQLAKRLE